MGRRTIRDSSSGGSLVPTKARGRIGEAGAGDGREREREEGEAGRTWTGPPGEGEGAASVGAGGRRSDGRICRPALRSCRRPNFPRSLSVSGRRGARRNNRLAFDPVFITAGRQKPDGRSGPNPPCQRVVGLGLLGSVLVPPRRWSERDLPIIPFLAASGGLLRPTRSRSTGRGWMTSGASRLRRCSVY